MNDPRLALRHIYDHIEWDRSHASYTFGFLLPGLIAAHRCKTIIEIGIADAFTTNVIGLSLARLYDPEEATLLSCDNTESACKRAEAVLAPLYIGHRVHHQDSHTMDWKKALAEVGKHHADMVLIDGSHQYEVVRQDIDRTRRVLRTRGLMVLHDYAPEYPGVLNAVNEFQAQAHWRELFIPYEPDSASSPSIILQRCQ